MTPVLMPADTPTLPLALELAQAATGELGPARQELAVYLLLRDGAFRYDARRHDLVPVEKRDLRPLAGPAALGSAALGLAYVADLVRMQVHAEDHGVCAGPDVRRMAGRVAQHCAALGLALAEHGTDDEGRLARALGLRATQRIRLVQGVGGPGQSRA